ncbi:MAG: protein kinase [Lachnospiraceae bacterium]
METKDNLRIPTEMEDINSRVKTEMEDFQSAKTDDNEVLADLVKKKNSFISSKGINYVYKNIISLDGGEGAVVLCNSEEFGNVAVKVYLDVRNVSLERREKIINFTNLEGADRYVLPILDNGLIELEDGTKNYFEVQVLCEDGDLLSKGKCSYDEIVEIVTELNDALHFIHSNGFLHMDIKPENIYFYKDRYVLGDFGITRELKEGQSITQITHFGKKISGTPGYQAPEVLWGTSYFELTSKTDYYSLAVTIASLYVGQFVFSCDGVYDAAQCQKSAKSSHIDLHNKSEKKTLLLQNLVDGLFQFDDNLRFDYDDVCKWLKDPFYKGSFAQNGNNIRWSAPFQGSNKTELIYTEKELFEWMSNNWNEAKNRLYKGHFEEHFKRNNESFVSQELLKITEDKYPNIEEQGDIALFEACMLVYSEADTPLVWKTKKWDSLQTLADEILTSEGISLYVEMFINRVVSYWLESAGLLANEEGLKRLILAMEKSTEINALITVYWFAYVFASEKTFTYKNKGYIDISELIEEIIGSPNELYRNGGHLDMILNLNKSYVLLGFICSGGKNRIGCNQFVFEFVKHLPEEKCGQVHLLFLMLEKIAFVLNKPELAEKIQKAYINYGPYGDIKYAHSLVVNTDYYFSNKEEGKEIIKELQKIPIIQSGDVSTVGKNLLKLKRNMDKLVENLQNNPILAEAGIYMNKTIKCKNLQGYYLYRFLDREVPLGYKRIVETED